MFGEVTQLRTDRIAKASLVVNLCFVEVVGTVAIVEAVRVDDNEDTT